MQLFIIIIFFFLGGGGVGVQILISIETYITCDFSGGGGGPDHLSSIGPTIEFLTSLPVKDGGPHDFRSKMAAPTTPRWRPPRHRDGGPCDAFGYTSEGESTP